MIVRPLAQDVDWDQYVGSTIRAFGGHDADAALDGAFAATPFMLDGF